MKEQWRQVGNAVPAKLAEEIAKEIKNTYNYGRHS